jgi:hypothetical protein
VVPAERALAQWDQFVDESPRQHPTLLMLVLLHQEPLTHPGATDLLTPKENEYRQTANSTKLRFRFLPDFLTTKLILKKE